MKILIQGGLWVLCLSLTTCNIPGQKKALADKVAASACQDVRSLMVDYGGSLIPLVGKSIMENLFKDKEGKGVLCDCVKNPVAEALDKRFTEEGLREMTDNSAERRAQIASVLLENKQKILDCYKESGTGKGVKFLDKFMDKIQKNLDKIKSDLEKKLEN